MERYNTESSSGRQIVARFCRCGHGAVIAADSHSELLEFEINWDNHHSDSGHGMVDFDEWLEVTLNLRLSCAK